MNIPSSTAFTGYNSGPVSPQKPAGVAAPAPLKKPDTPATEAVEKSARINDREDSQRFRTRADSDTRSTAAQGAATAEYLPVRDDDNAGTSISARSLVSDSQRPEIQAFLNTSAGDGTSRRGRFIDIQA